MPRGGRRRDVRRPAVGAAQHLRQRRPLRGDARRLDEVEERRAHLAEQHQCDQPPRRRQHDAQQPPPGEPPPQPVRPMTRPPDDRGQAAGERRDRVDRTHQRDRHRGPRGQYPHVTRSAHRQDHRQQHPRRQHHRQRLRRDRAEGRQHPRRQRERRRGDDPRRRGADAQRLRHPQQAPEPDGQQQCPPQPLRHPSGDTQRVPEQEERAVREQVAVRLVLGLAERQLAAPQVRRAGEEPQRAAVRSSFVSGEIRPGDWAKHRISAAAPTAHSQRRDNGATAGPGPSR